MKNQRLFYFRSVVFLFVLASITNCRKDQPSIELEKEAIKQTLIDMWQAIEEEDLEAYALFIHPDFTQFGETDSILRIGKEAEVKGVASWIKNSSNIQTEMHKPRITIRDKTAWISYYWSDSGITDGSAFTSRGKSTRIFVKEKGRWLCIHGHYTLLPNKTESYGN